MNSDRITNFAITVVLMAAVAGNLDRLNHCQVATAKVLWESRASAWCTPQFWPEQNIKNHKTISTNTKTRRYCHFFDQQTNSDSVRQVFRYFLNTLFKNILFRVISRV